MGKQSTRAWKYLLLFLACLSLQFLFNCALIQDSKRAAEEPKSFEEAREYLRLGHKLLLQKDYEGARLAYQKVRSFTPGQPLEDQALWGMAMIDAHFGNPNKNYKKSIEHLLTLLNEYPQSDLVEQAKIWVGVLLENVESNQKIEKLYETLQNMEKIKHTIRESQKGRSSEPRWDEHTAGRELLQQSLKALSHGNFEGAISENQKVLSSPDPRSPKAEALFNLGFLFAHYENPQRNIERSIDFFNRLIKNHPKSPWVEHAKIWIGVLQENEELTRLIQKLKQVDIEVEEMKRKR